MFAPKRIICFALFLVLFGFGPALAQWSTPVRISEPGRFLYPQISAKGDTLHVVFTHIGFGRGIGYVRSTDAALTWGQEIELSDTVNTNDTNFPKIMGCGRSLLAAWIGNLSHDPYTESVYYNVSSDDGMNWSQNQRIRSTDRGNIVYFAASGYDSLVNIMFYSRPHPDSLAFYNIRTTDFGTSWSQPREVFRSTQSDLPDQASQDSLVHFTWAGNFHWGGIWETYYFRSIDGGLTWSSNTPISRLDQYISETPAIAVDQAGNPAISWWDFRYSPYQLTGDILARWSSDGGVTWGRENQITHNHLADLSDICWVGDTIRIVWDDFRFGAFLPTVYYSSAFDSSGSWGSEERVEGDPESSMLPAMAYSNDHVYVVWYDSRCTPDTDICGGIYFARRPAEPDAVTEPEIPDKIEALEAYPNPFNSSTTISYSNLEEGGEMAIYNLTGQKIKTYAISDGKEGKIVWHATDASGKTLSSGIYFARAQYGSKGTSNSHVSRTLKLTFLK